MDYDDFDVLAKEDGGLSRFVNPKSRPTFGVHSTCWKESTRAKSSHQENTLNSKQVPLQIGVTQILSRCKTNTGRRGSSNRMERDATLHSQNLTTFSLKAQALESQPAK